MTKEKVKEKPKEFSVSDAKKLLEQEHQIKIKRCSERIFQILKEEGCTIRHGITIMSDGGFTPILQIIPAQQPQEKPEDGD